MVYFCPLQLEIGSIYPKSYKRPDPPQTSHRNVDIVTRYYIRLYMISWIDKLIYTERQKVLKMPLESKDHKYEKKIET